MRHLMYLVGMNMKSQLVENWKKNKNFKRNAGFLGEKSEKSLREKKPQCNTCENQHSPINK